MKLKFLFFGLLLSMISFAQNSAKVSGIITDKDSKQPVSFVSISLKGLMANAESDINGNYEIAMKPGTYTIVYAFIGYKTFEKEVTVTDNETLNLNISLQENSNSIEGIVITGSTSKTKETALLKEQQKAVEIKQSIGAQEMSRKGISDVEEGLTKVTGISKVDGRGIFVRGLEDRYNSLLINGLTVPSNNPFKKIIPLDIFPTDIVGIIETYKTFNTNLYGDFAGGTFNILTSTGEKSQTKFSLGAGYTTGNNIAKFLMSKDAKSTGDFFGFSGNERDMPGVFGSKPAYLTLTPTQSRNSFGSGYDVESTKSPLNTSIGMSHSEKFNIGKNKNIFRYLLSLNFDNKYQVREGVSRFFNTQQGNYDNNLYFNQYKYSTNGSALVALNYKSDRLNLTSNTFYLKTTDNTIQDQVGSRNGTTANSNAFIRMNELQETDYLNTQLFGNYKLTKNERHNLKAGGSFTTTNYQLPDRKSFSGVKIDDNTTAISYSGNSLFRQFLNFDGKFHASGLLEYSWKFGKEDIDKSHKLTVGYNSYVNNVASSFRFLVSKSLLAPNSISFPTNSPDAVLSNELENGIFTYTEGSNATYKTKLNEAVQAGYFDLAFKFGEKVDLNFGARAEQTNREIKYKKTGSFDAAFITKKVEKTDILPSLNAKYALTENSNIRFAGSKTITRPVIMEAYPLEFVNPDGTIEQGNENITNSENINLDLKYELFPTAKELFVVSAFSKFIQNPIERIFIPSAGSGGQIISYDNSKKAVLFGAEFEFLFQLDRISKSLQDLSFGLNTTLMYSKVNINTVNSPETIAIGEKNPSRNLQGASPWIINADLKYDFDFNKNWKNTMTIVYNVYGKRIYAVGTGKLDHYYELPFSKLDFVWNNKIGKNWDLKLSADNLLNPLYQIELGRDNKVEITETDYTVKDYKKGIGFSFNLSYTF